MLPQLINMLSWWQWLILAAVPPAIIALYFLKLRRRPLEVPSTYLWHRSIEDLHVNTVWQRLRRNLLLFLQLLLVFLAMLAVLRPGWRGSKVTGNRFIFLIDHSASMQATDSGRSRLEEAKRQARAKIDQMTSRDAAMIVSFSDSARVVEMFTHNRGRLRRALDSIRPTQRPTSLFEALKVASPLANPGRSAEDAGDFQVADPLPAALYIFSDGRFPSVADFRLGNLDPVYMPIGKAEAANVGILAFSVRRNELIPALSQAFARLKNFGSKGVTVELELRLDGQLNNAARVWIPPGETEGEVFPLGTIESGVLELRIINDDDLACDNTAWAVVNPPRRSKMLVVTPGNEVLDIALGTDTVAAIADVTVASPGFLNGEQYQKQAAVGAYDLVIYDRCRPQEMPQANTLFIGALPPAKGGDGGEKEPAQAAGEGPPKERAVWRAGPKAALPVIIDTDASHPLMQWIDMGNVEFYEATPLEVPQGGTVLIDSHVGPIFAVAPREGFEDAVMGFVFVEEAGGEDGAPATYVRTTWPIRASFPVFVLNLLHYFGRGAALSGAALQPGQPAALERPAPDKPLEVQTPSGKKIELSEGRSGKLTFTGTSELGVYEVRSSGKTLQHFAVNLFHGLESDIPTSSEIKIGRGTPIEGQTSGWETTRRELWKTLLLLGLAILCFEWYVYNRRVYL